MPAAAFAQETAGNVPQPDKSQNVPQPDKSQTDKKLNMKLSEEKEEPRASLDKEFNYTDPINYPLINDGEYVDYLWDSYGTPQHIFFENVSDSAYYTDYMNLKLYYYSDYLYSKDSILDIEYFQEEDNYLYYLGETEFDTYGYSSVYLNSDSPKADYSNEQYIYLRIGVRDSIYDSYYSDTMTFKVVNPYYNSGSNPANDDQYAVISNESVNATLSQPTGTFNVKDMEYTKDKSLTPSAYQIDMNRPFDSAANKSKVIQKSAKSGDGAYRVGDSKSFWVTDFTTNSDYQINARLAYSGTKANVWVNNYEISDAQAAQMGKEFDNKIHSSVTNNFGTESDVNQDGKVNILNFDIQDGFSGSGGYIGGYFWAGDLYNVSASNQSEIFYIDTYPAMGTGTKDVTEAYGTLAHEFQHMVNFNRNVLIEGSSSNMDTWLNEALSMAAEQVYSGVGISSRVDYYNASTSISNGHSLLNWDDNGDVLSNYSLSYLFGQYIKIQMNQGDRIFKEILQDSNNNYLAIENAAKKYISPNMTFGKLMTNFRIALLLKRPTGYYGFKGDPFFDAIEEKVYSGSSANLLGGGSIVTTFSSTEGFVVPTNKGANISYTTFPMDGSYTGDTTPPAAPTVSPVTDQDTTVKGKTEANAQITVYAGTSPIGNGFADTTGAFSISIPKQNSGTVISVTARDSAGNESTTKVTVVISYTKVNVQLNGKAFTSGYSIGGNTYVHWKALETFKIPHTYKGNGIFTIEGRSVTAQSINGGLYIAWSQLSPGKVTYQAITGGYNFIYAVPTKIQLNGKDFTGGYYKNGNTYVHWKALDTFKIPYVFKGNGVFTIEGRTVKAETINGGLYIAWNQLSPGKVTFKTLTGGGYNFIYAVPIKVQLNGKDFLQGYFKDGNTYIHWSSLKTFNIPHTFKGGVLFDIGGRSVSGEKINDAIYIRWNLIAPGKITYKTITGGYNFIYTP